MLGPVVDSNSDYYCDKDIGRDENTNQVISNLDKVLEVVNEVADKDQSVLADCIDGSLFKI
jgi:hypothetical protein